ncbi:MAG: tail fiber domain-containing protein [Bacteroidales bacterium]|nr:tail fiber domain-containing protein [Bacteroidales bacterium]MDT8431030.1 tail fiber domain-containing protein [Bacteroidales bacterium]
MRKITLSFSILVICILASGQINVDTNGDVTIGNTYDAPRTLDVDGDTYIDGHVGIGNTPSTSYLLRIGSYSTANSDVLRVNGYTEFYSDYNGLEFRNSPSPYDMSILPQGYGSTLGSNYNAFDEVWTYDLYELSDSRLKENIRNMDNALSIVLQLNPVTFDFKKEFRFQDSLPYTSDQIARIEKKRKDVFGFIAQDVEKIIPSVVFHSDTSDMYGMNYIKLIPVLAGAIKEQNSIIENLQAEISSLKNSNLKFLATNGEDKNIDDQHILYQNAPNPFSENTIINYFLSDGIDDAQIIIYDMTGLQLNRISLNDVGESSVEISAGELRAGMYIFSLIVDGKFIDSKQMVITD